MGREKALQEHPDKGGDDTRFHQLAKAYEVLEDDKRREAYDEELLRLRERATLVDGSEKHLTKQADAPLRVKTAPTPGSTRSKKTGKSHPSAQSVLKAIKDDVPIEGVAEALFSKYSTLPRDKEKRRDWTHSIKGEEKQALKACAKAYEA